MIESFPTYTAANTWIAEHPEWKPVSIIPGIGSGSLMVLFEAHPPYKPKDSSGLTLDELFGGNIDNAPPHKVAEFLQQKRKRRGRPPKVKDA